MTALQDPLYADLCQVLSKILARGYYNPYSCTSAIALLEDWKVRLQSCCTGRYGTGIQHSCIDMNHTETQESAGLQLPMRNIHQIVFAWSSYEEKFGPLLPHGHKVYIGSPILPGEWERRVENFPDETKRALSWKFGEQRADEIMQGL